MIYYYQMSKGIMKEAFNETNRFKKQVEEFYKDNGYCPEEEGEHVNKFLSVINLKKGIDENTCLIVANIAERSPTVGGKKLTLEAVFNEDRSVKYWKCSTDVWYESIINACH